jgi:A/G-specific adenine glycosylase
MRINPSSQEHGGKRRSSRVLNHAPNFVARFPRSRCMVGEFSRRRLATMSSHLARFYLAKGRRYPWRSTHDSFQIGIAEILLQKTRADSVVRTYRDIIRSYPTPSRLALAKVRCLEGQLKPIGLFRKRARALIGFGAAVEEVGVSVLRDLSRSVSLPGIGAYGARAIACFGFNSTVGIVDANVRRVLTRVFGLVQMDPRDKRYQELADRIVESSSQPRAVNFGLLDLGALICGRKPNCEVCPLARMCQFNKFDRRR